MEKDLSSISVNEKQTNSFKKYMLGDIGRIEDVQDERDFSLLAIVPHDTKLPAKISWKDKVPMVLDQGPFGICVGAAGTAMENIQKTIKGNCPAHGFSPIYLYTLCKSLDGDKTNKNWGTYSRSAAKVLCSDGILPYVELPTTYLKTNKGKLPVITQDQIQRATKNKCKSYASVPMNITAIKKALMRSPILGSFNVNDSFWDPEQNKYIKKPAGQFCGGHCMCIIGYDNDIEYTYEDGTHYKGFLEIQNSWSTGWGNSGFAYIPYDLLKLESNILIYAAWSVIDSTTQVKKLWRIHSSKFTNKEDAQAHQIQLKKKKISTCLEYIDDESAGLVICVQIRTYISEKTCKAYSETLTKKGIQNYIVYY